MTTAALPSMPLGGTVRSRTAPAPPSVRLYVCTPTRELINHVLGNVLHARAKLACPRKVTGALLYRERLGPNLCAKRLNKRSLKVCELIRQLPFRGVSTGCSETHAQRASL